MKHIFLSLICMASAVANAQVKSLQECRDLALYNNEAIKIAKTQLNKIGYESDVVKSQFMPRLSLIAFDFYSTAQPSIKTDALKLPTMVFDPTVPGYYRPNTTTLPNGDVVYNEITYIPEQKMKIKVKNVFMAGVNIEQPIYMGGKISTAYRMSKMGIELGMLNVKLNESQVVVNTDEAYILCVKAKEMTKVANRYMELLQELKRNVDSAYKHGMKVRNDVMKVQVKINEVELKIKKAENAFLLAKLNLLHTIGMPLTAQIDVDENSVLPLVSTTTGKDEGSEGIDALARPEYKIVNMKEELAREQINLVKSDYRPQVVALAGVSYAHGLEFDDKTMINSPMFNIGVGVKVPLYSFGERKSKLRSAKASYELASQEMSDIHNKLQLEIVKCHNTLSEAYMEMELTKKSLEQAEENVRLSKSQYEVGSEPLSNLLEAHALWQEAYANVVESRCQYLLANSRYLKATAANQ